MSNDSYLTTRPAKERGVYIPQGYLELCKTETIRKYVRGKNKGEEYTSVKTNHCAAGILLMIERFAHWKIRQLKGTPKPSDYWVWMPQDQMEQFELVGAFGETQIKSAIKLLMKRGFLSRRKNPNIGFDRTFQYRFETETVQAALDKLAPFIGIHEWKAQKSMNASMESHEAIPQLPSQLPSHDKDYTAAENIAGGDPPPSSWNAMTPLEREEIAYHGLTGGDLQEDHPAEYTRLRKLEDQSNAGGDVLATMAKALEKLFHKGTGDSETEYIEALVAAQVPVSGLLDLYEYARENQALEDCPATLEDMAVELENWQCYHRENGVDPTTMQPIDGDAPLADTKLPPYAVGDTVLVKHLRANAKVTAVRWGQTLAGHNNWLIDIELLDGAVWGANAETTATGLELGDIEPYTPPADTELPPAAFQVGDTSEYAVGDRVTVSAADSGAGDIRAVQDVKSGGVQWYTVAWEQDGKLTFGSIAETALDRVAPDKPALKFKAGDRVRSDRVLSLFSCRPVERDTTGTIINDGVENDLQANRIDYRVDWDNRRDMDDKDVNGQPVNGEYLLLIESDPPAPPYASTADLLAEVVEVAKSGGKQPAPDKSAKKSRLRKENPLFEFALKAMYGLDYDPDNLPEKTIRSFVGKVASALKGVNATADECQEALEWHVAGRGESKPLSKPVAVAKWPAMVVAWRENKTAKTSDVRYANGMTRDELVAQMENDAR